MIATLALLGALVAQDAAAIERQVAAAPDGEVRLTFAARPGVVGNGYGIIGWDCTDWGRCSHQRMDDGNDAARADWRALTEPGPVRVSLRVRERTVVGLRTYVGGAWRPAERVTDLGRVPAAAAARYFLALARRDGGRPARDAIFAAALADSIRIWPDLLAMARNRDIRTDTRKQAVFWLGQAAEDAATASLDSLADASDEDVEVREAAVFALSQRPRDEGIPALIRIARSHRDARLRRRAMFWLAQSDDSRAIELFEEILTRK